jgi:hypothetical protein
VNDNRDMASAPTDGTWIVGIDKDGMEARIQSRVTHPLCPTVRHWGDGATVMEGHWERSKCFYPVAWRPE